MTETSLRGAVLTNISNALVGLHKQYYGKGPTKTKTYIVDDTVLCVLRGGFTVVERTLVSSGRADPVREMRHAFQHAMRAQFTRVIEEAVGRKVVAYLSQVSTDPEVCVEVFLLDSSDEEKSFEQGAAKETDTYEGQEV